MRARIIDREVPTIGTVRFRIYHSCPAFHCGSALGPGVMGRWWAERGLEGWVYLWDIDNVRAQYPLEETIADALYASPADLARAAQDARAESPDV
jgi:hypothetical protein